MARDPAVSDGEESARYGPRVDAIDRRTYVRLAGVTTATAGLVGSASASGGSQGHEDLLVVDGRGTTGRSRYEFAVSGSVEPVAVGTESIESGHVTGTVADWRDAFRVEGELSLLTVDGPATVQLNGDEIEPDQHGQRHPHVLTVASATAATYEASVDGTIEGGTLASESVAARSVETQLESGRDHYRFSGELADVTILGGDATVAIDGERIDPTAATNGTVLPHAVVFEAADGTGSYRFSVDGDVVKSSYRDATSLDDDLLDGPVSGTVAGGRAAYWFEGSISDLAMAGNATVDIAYDVHDR